MAIRFSVESSGVTRTYHLKKSVVTFGRSRQCTVYVADPALSRTHCQVELEDKGISVRDLNSRNGTILNGDSINRAQLETDDVISIGNTLITFLGTGEEQMVENADEKTAQWTEQLFSDVSPGGKHSKGEDSPETEVRRLRRLLSINRKIAAEIEIEKVLTVIIDTAVDFVGAERGFVVTVEKKGLSIPVARDFWHKDIQSPSFELSRSIALAVVKRGIPVIAEDANCDERFDQVNSVQNLKIRSVLCVPLKVKKRIIGALYLDNRLSRGTFSTRDQSLLESLADQAAISLLNSGRFEETREATVRWREQAIRQGGELRSVRAQIQQLERNDGLTHDYSRIMGRSEAMRSCLGQVDRVIDTDLPVLLRGESGTGKELVARAIHGNGPRKGAPLVPLDCASLSAGLIESELFGHAKGAFTDSHQDREGLFESADGGTLFLDEVGDMPLELQSRLLRVLETGEVRRLGESRTRKVDVRIVSATRRNLESMMEQGEFREDLYYRLKGMRIDIPALRERGDDILLLLGHFLEHAGSDITVSAKAQRRLVSYGWPGNVRELKNEALRMATVVDDVVNIGDLPDPIRHSGGLVMGLEGSLKSHVEGVEREFLIRALRAHDGNKTRAAEALGLSRLGLRKKMARYGIDS